MDIGIDGKVALSSALNLDLTVNPDFSQVDVDQQVTNLSRYELFFPEKRQFFLENGDQFTNFGYSTIRPFFSRRIGLRRSADPFRNPSEREVEPGLASRRDGDEDRRTRMNMGSPPQNFAVVALQRRVFSRSNIGFMLVDKESSSHEPAGRPALASSYQPQSGRRVQPGVGG